MEFVGPNVTRRNGTLSDARDTILIIGAVLTKPVPMDGRSIVNEQVCDCDLQHISVVSLDEWPRRATVDQERWP